MADNPSDSDGFIRITNREVWNKLTSVEEAVGRMENKLSTQLEENVGLRKRIRLLELFSYGVISALSGAVIVIGRLKGVPLG